MEKMPAKLLIDRSIIGSKGKIIGKVKDIVFDEKIGKLVSLEVEPVENSPVMIEAGKNVLIPYKLVKSIEDVVIVDEDGLKRVHIRVADH